MRQSDDSILINRSFEVIDESPDWIVVAKPPHLLIHPTRPDGPFTLWDGLKELLAFELSNGGQVSIINRLDRETSGLVLVAKHAATARQLGIAMLSGAVEKEYLALVFGHPGWDFRRLEARLLRQGEETFSNIHLKQMVHPRGAAATTEFTLLQKYSTPEGQSVSLLRAVPLTGRTHQIRVHCAFLGHPVIGDKIYGADENCYLEFIETGWTPSLGERLLLPRQALHSASLEIPTENLSWSSSLAPDLQDFVQTLTYSHA